MSPHHRCSDCYRPRVGLTADEVFDFLTRQLAPAAIAFRARNLRRLAEGIGACACAGALPSIVAPSTTAHALATQGRATARQRTEQRRGAHVPAVAGRAAQASRPPTRPGADPEARRPERADRPALPLLHALGLGCLITLGCDAGELETETEGRGWWAALLSDGLAGEVG